MQHLHHGEKGVSKIAKVGRVAVAVVPRADARVDDCNHQDHAEDSCDWNDGNNK